MIKWLIAALVVLALILASAIYAETQRAISSRTMSAVLSATGFLFPLGAGVLIIVYSIHVIVDPQTFLKLRESRRPSGYIQEEMRNGFPALTWTQSMGTGKSKAEVGQILTFVTITTILCALAAIFLLPSGQWAYWWTSVVFAMFMGIGAVGSIDVSQDQSVPDHYREDCVAFIQEHDGILYFCSGRQVSKNGTIRQHRWTPWETLTNFELGSRLQWMGGHATSGPKLDWRIIHTDAKLNGAIVVAEWVHDEIWIAALRNQLEAMFISGRAQHVARWKKAQSPEPDLGSSGMPEAPQARF